MLVYETCISHIKINFTLISHEIFMSRMKLKQFLYEILFSYVKLYVKFFKEKRSVRLATTRVMNKKRSEQSKV